MGVQAKLFRAFADLSRLSILESLRDGPRKVSQIVEETGLNQPNTSNHLGCLRECGLVTCRQEGRFVYYELSDARVASLLDLADELLDEVAGGVGACRR